MNQRDQANLQFLLNANAKALTEWYQQASQDDIMYAFELLVEYEHELDQTESSMLAEDFGLNFINSQTNYLQ